MPEESAHPGELAPGMFVSEVPSGLRSVTGAGTSTPAFLGYTLRADVRDPGFYTPMPVRSWGEFTDRYATTPQGTSLFEELGKAVRRGEDTVLGALSAVTGDRTPAAAGPEIERGLALSEAVYGFFANGGSSCYVVPLPADDGRFASLVTALEGDAKARTGLAGLEAVPHVTMVVAPDLAVSAPTDRELAVGAQKIAAHCAKMRNRMVILDTRHDPAGKPMTTAPALVTDHQQQQFAAVYYPWVQVPGVDGKPRTVPPSGHIAGVWARTDDERGVFKAPANVSLQEVTGLSVSLTDEQQGPLNERGVNCLRAFPGRGPMVWGARTLATDGEWRYLNVRRFACFLSDSIEQSTRWAVFEPNDERLWSSLRHAVTGFLADQWRRGALQGAKPDEAFYVICDKTNNPDDAIAQGQVQCDIGVAPVRPAEFVHITIRQKAGQPTTS